MQAALSGLRDSSEALFGVARNRLSISASASITELWVIPRLARLSQATGAEISLRTMVVTSGGGKDDDTIRIRYGAGDWADSWRMPLYDELLAPVAAPSLLKRGRWQELPRLAVAGPRPGWNFWSDHTGAPTTPVPHLRFDTFSSALAAARAGLGVLLASVPLAAADLSAGRVQRVSEETLPHHETYWLLAARDRVSRRQWDQLSGCLTGQI